MAFTAKQHDTAPAYVADLADDFGLVSEAPINLTSATSVRFLMRKNGQTGTPKVSSVMTVTDAANGRVQHNWGTADLDTVGTYDVEFEITWTDGTIETVPNDTYLTINVVDDLTD
jgi:hypothetical protein